MPIWVTIAVTLFTFAVGYVVGVCSGIAYADEGRHVLRGTAARDFLAEMSRERTPDEIAVREAFKKQCIEAYKKSRGVPGPSKEESK